MPLKSLPRILSQSAEASSIEGGVLVACPDARPPAYQAVVGFARAGLLQKFVTGFYYGGRSAAVGWGKKLWAQRAEGWERVLRRRHHPAIPPGRVCAKWSYDLALAAENRLGGRSASARRLVARTRTRRFDRALARLVEWHDPQVAFVFSDVASEFTLPACRDRGVATILSMVHGDVREERELLEQEAERAPDFFPIYLAEGTIDRRELDWLHERRLRDIALADRILVPSEHIAVRLMAHGTARERIAVVPYAADTERFVPDAAKRHRNECTFLFAGGITQRKGIKYLLEAWRLVRRPGWRLQLLGPLPAHAEPLASYLDEVELLGRVGHAEVPKLMASADVFVFPSLFEGSAVVTYEALACGLPSVVTPSAGAVVRDGLEGFEVAPGDMTALAERMERLGNDPALRAQQSQAARERALEFTWSRYHASLVAVVENLVQRDSQPPGATAWPSAQGAAP